MNNPRKFLSAIDVDSKRDCEDPVVTPAIMGPRSMTNFADGTTEFAGAVEGNGLFVLRNIAPDGYWIRINAISFSLYSGVQIPVVIEFFDPFLAGAGNQNVMRLLSPTADGGTDVQFYVFLPPTDFYVPVHENGACFDLRCITTKAASGVSTEAYFYLSYTFVRKVA